MVGMARHSRWQCAFRSPMLLAVGMAALSLAHQAAVADPPYQADPPMCAPSITSPYAEAVWCAREQYELSAATVYDQDRCVDQPDVLVDDEVNYYAWSQSGNVGTFPNGSLGQSVAWRAPDRGGDVTFTVTADDAVLWEGGDDAATTSNGVTAKIVKVEVTPTSAGNTPDISPRICLNAEAEYRKAKWQVTVEPTDTSANVQVYIGDVAAEPMSGVCDGDEIEVTGGVQVGGYRVRVQHNLSSSCYDDAEEMVFEFVGVRPARFEVSEMVIEGDGTDGGDNGDGSMWLTSDQAIPDVQGSVIGTLQGDVTVITNPADWYVDPVKATVSFSGPSAQCAMRTYTWFFVTGYAWEELTRSQVLSGAWANPRTIPLETMSVNSLVPGETTDYKSWGWTGSEVFSGTPGSAATIKVNACLAGYAWGLLSWASGNALISGPQLSIGAFKIKTE